MAKDREPSPEPLDPVLADQLAAAAVIEPVDAGRRRELRARLEQELGSLEEVRASAGPGRVRSRAPSFAAGVLLAAAAAAALWTFAGSSTSASVPSGQLSGADERVSMNIGTRGVAVAEPSARMSWASDPHRVRVDQERGQVFYRVESGAPFEVHTPHGRVEVQGASFEVDVVMNKLHRSKHIAIGASIAAATVVTVYEGEALLASEGGTEVVGPGERAAIEEGGAGPGRARSRVDEPRQRDATGSSARPAAAGADELAEMRRQVRALEAELAAAKATDSPEADVFDQDAFTRSFFDPTPEQAREAAKNCNISYAVPQLGSGSSFVPDAEAERLGLSDRERDDLERGLSELSAARKRALRELYVELTGDDTEVEQLSEPALLAEIRDKATPEETTAARQRVSQVRAGLALASDPAEASPMERLYQSEVATAKATLKLLQDIVGEEAIAVLGDSNLRLMMNMEDGCESEPTSAESQ